MHLKKLKRFTPLLILPFFALTAYAAFKHPQWSLFFGILTFIPGYLLVLLALLPIGRKRFGQPHRTSFLRWFAKLCYGQFTLLVLFIALVISFLGAGPEYIQQAISLSDAVNSVKSYQLWWGIFPWGTIGLWGLCVCYVYYIKQQGPFAHHMAESICHRRLEGPTKAFIELIVYAASTACIALAIVSGVLLISYAVQLHFNLTHHLFVPYIIVFLVCLLMPWLGLKLGNKFIRFLQHRKFSMASMIFVTMITLIVVIMISGILAGWLITYAPEKIAQTKCDCAKYFEGPSQQIRFASLYWGWWLIWVPLAGSWVGKYLARSNH